MSTWEGSMVIDVMKGEELPITITYAGSPDLSSATMSFAMKEKLSDEEALVAKDDDDFDDTQEAEGIAQFTLTDTDTNACGAGEFIGQIKAEWGNGQIFKSEFLIFRIRDVVI